MPSDRHLCGTSLKNLTRYEGVVYNGTHKIVGFERSLLYEVNRKSFMIGSATSQHQQTRKTICMHRQK